jgi:hypothetical protein
MILQIGFNTPHLILKLLILLREKEPNAILSCLFSEEILTFISTNLKKPGLDFIISFAKTSQDQHPFSRPQSHQRAKAGRGN